MMNDAGFIRSTRRGMMATVGMVALMCTAAPAWAQSKPVDTPAPADADARAEDGEIVVTGSRIARRDYDSASPIVTVTQEQFNRQSGLTPDTYLQSLPQVGSAFGQGSNNAGNNGIAAINLHYLGANRTLVLLDGRRAVPGEGGNSVDISLIPQTLIKSVEIITGGASAVYGSDAIAGVVNFKLDDRFEGLKLSGTAGVSTRGDAGQYGIDAVYGWRSKTGNGGFVAYGGYSDRQFALATSRPNTAQESVVTFNAAGAPVISPFINNNLPDGAISPAAANLPSQAAVNTYFARFGVAPGTVPRTSALGFNTDGTLFANNPTTNNRSVGANRNPYVLNNFEQNYLQLPAQRYIAGFLGDWEIVPDVTVYSRFSFMRSEVRRQINPVNLPATALPAALVSSLFPGLSGILASRPSPNATVSVVRNLAELGPRSADYKGDQYEGLIGLRGSFAPSWNYDIYYSRGRLDRTEVAGGALLVSRLNALLTAADGGRALCGGFSIFGIGSISQQCVNFLNYNPTTRTISDQEVVEGNVTGSLFTLPGGAAKVSVGALYRRNSFSIIGDPQVNAGNVLGGLRTNSSIASNFNVKEIFGELYLPLLGDRPFAEILDVTLGYRYSDYSASANTNTYKAELVYAPIKQVRFRGSFQRAVRAPSPTELFLPLTPSNESIVQDPCSFNSAFRAGNVAGVTPANVRTLCLAQGIPAAIIDTFVGPTAATGTRTGSLNLQPEKADSYTVGAVIRPEFGGSLFRNLSLSADYWRIEVSGAIAQLGLNDSVTRCFNLLGLNPNYSPTNQFCGNFSRNTNGGITNALVTFTNIGALRIAGVDAQIDWAIPLDSVIGGQNTRLDLNFGVSRLVTVDQQSLAGAPFSNLRGSIGAVGSSAFPTWKSTLGAQLTFGQFDIGTRWRHISAMITQAKALSPTINSLGTPAIDYVDLNLGFRVDKSFTLRFGVENLADVQPPIYSTPSGNNTDPTTFDVIGRRVFMRVETRF